MKKLILLVGVFCVLLASCSSMKNKDNNITSLEGTWELNYISGARIAFDGLYPNKKPEITFDLKEQRFFGNNSCNSYSGKLAIDGNKISFKEPMATTKKMCIDNQGENAYMKTLQKINSYSVSKDGKTLNFIMGDIGMMRFEKK